jgi:hypothetical protein
MPPSSAPQGLTRPAGFSISLRSLAGMRIACQARRGRVSRAAKGADCKSAGYAFVGSSPTSPTIHSHKKLISIDFLPTSQAARQKASHLWWVFPSRNAPWRCSYSHRVAGDIFLHCRRPIARGLFGGLRCAELNRLPFTGSILAGNIRIDRPQSVRPVYRRCGSSLEVLPKLAG